MAILPYAHNLRRMAHDLRDVAEWTEKDEGRARLRLVQAREILRGIAGPEETGTR